MLIPQAGGWMPPLERLGSKGMARLPGNPRQPLLYPELSRHQIA
jgi:hypothetical protein